MNFSVTSKQHVCTYTQVWCICFLSVLTFKYYLMDSTRLVSLWSSSFPVSFPVHRGINQWETYRISIMGIVIQAKKTSTRLSDQLPWSRGHIWQIRCQCVATFFKKDNRFVHYLFVKYKLYPCNDFYCTLNPFKVMYWLDTLCQPILWFMLSGLVLSGTAWCWCNTAGA